MYRKALLSVVVLAGSMILAASSAQARLTSPYNPYRSFNSGVNYGAQQWERDHNCHRGGGLYSRQR